MARFYRDVTPQTLAAREAQFQAYRSWEIRHREDPTPSQTLAAIGVWVDLLPPPARTRTISAEGVQEMHRSLAVLR